MKAMVMAAGLGTRLRPLTDFLPKPMMPIANRPVLHRFLNLDCSAVRSYAQDARRHTDERCEASMGCQFIGQRSLVRGADEGDLLATITFETASAVQ
jgi:hypothetical protein